MLCNLSVPNRLLKVSSNSGSLVKRAISRTIKVKKTSVFGLDRILIIMGKGIPLNPKGSIKKKEGTRVYPFFILLKIPSITLANSSFLILASILCQFLKFGS